MNKEQNIKEKRKRRYQKPEIRKVKMVVEEALTPGCKTPASLGPTGSNPCLVDQCFTPGS